MNATALFLTYSRANGQADKAIPTSLHDDPAIETFDGVVLTGDAKRCVFLFEVHRANSSPKENLLCGFSAYFYLPPASLARLLIPGRRLHLTGCQVTPSVYKPFRFEVMSLQEDR